MNAALRMSVSALRMCYQTRCPHVGLIQSQSFADSSAQKLIDEGRVQAFYLLFNQDGMAFHSSSAMKSIGVFIQTPGRRKVGVVVILYSFNEIA